MRIPSLNECGHVRIAVYSPDIAIGNPYRNRENILAAIHSNTNTLDDFDIHLFPELCITGYTCGDLFTQTSLIQDSMEAVLLLAEDTRAFRALIVVGLPLEVDNKLFNVAAVLHAGEILGFIPKTFIPNYSEFYEKRWFSSAKERRSDVVWVNDMEIPFSENLVFEDNRRRARIGIEICEDLWTPVPPSSILAMNGANILLNLSASNELTGKSEYRRSLIQNQSARTICAYAYASAGPGESTVDTVFSGHLMICENGIPLLDHHDLRELGPQMGWALVDVDRLETLRRRQGSFSEYLNAERPQKIRIALPDRSDLTVDETQRIQARTPRLPFVPQNPEALSQRCDEITTLQARGLAQKLTKSKIGKVVIGISGGLDSTLALLVAHKTMQILRKPASDILGVTMPGFGTTGKTHQNAVSLMDKLGVTALDIDITESCRIHLKDIDHDPKLRDITYENAQARERTQILMDLGNKYGAMVVGTGNLSEIALGWCTYSGDHMSMYAVNSGIPKTLVKTLVQWFADNESDPETLSLIQNIYETPISPELLPADESGEIAQKTEDLIGPYELHDFFLYHMVQNGYAKPKIQYLAKLVFADTGVYSEDEIDTWLNAFYHRFVTQQFKRSCMPEGVKIGSVSLSPRTDWRMPSEAEFAPREEYPR